MAESSRARVAVVGLGSMGLGIAQSLLRAGVSVIGCDVDAQAAARFAAAAGQVAGSPHDAARHADAVVTVVVTAAQTEAVLFGPTGAAAAFDAAQPVLEAIAQKVYRLGDRAGIGASFKIINQLLAGVHSAAACEAITLAKRLDLDINTVYEVITASAGNSWMFGNRIPHVLAGDYTPHSAIDIFAKDLGILGDIAREEKFPLMMAATAMQMFLMTSAAGMGRDDDSSVARLLARISGLDLPGASGSASPGVGSPGLGSPGPGSP